MAYSILVSAQGPLLLGLGLKGLGLRVWGQGLTIILMSRSFSSSLFNFDKYSFEYTIENSDTETENINDDDILDNIKDVIRNEKKFE